MSKGSTIEHCEKCGAYLGDRIDGKLWNFGQEVTEPHVCETAGSNTPEVVELKPPKTAEIRIAPRDDVTVVNLYLEAVKMLDYAKGRVISTNEDLKPATEDLSLIANYKKAIEEKRKEYTVPIREKLDLVNEAFKELMAPVLEADKITRDKILWFHNEQNRLREEAERIEAEKLRLAQAEMELKGEHTVDLEPVEKPEVVPDRIRTQVGDAGTMDVWKYEVVDFALVPDEFKVVDHTMLGAIARKHHDAKQVPGIRFYSEKTLRVNTR